ARLADRAGVEQPATLELELRSRRCDAAGDVVARLAESERDVAVADEHERRRRHAQAHPRDLFAQYVVPDRIARTAVEELDGLAGAPDRVDPLCVDVREHGVERMQVPVDVGDDGDAHRAPQRTWCATAATILGA